jgi:hypothetical protein
MYQFYRTSFRKFGLYVFHHFIPFVPLYRDDYTFIRRVVTQWYFIYTFNIAQIQFAYRVMYIFHLYIRIYARNAYGWITRIHSDDIA